MGDTPRGRHWGAAGRTWMWEARYHRKRAVASVKAGDMELARLFARAVLLYKWSAEACFQRARHSLLSLYGHDRADVADTAADVAGAAAEAGTT